MLVRAKCWIKRSDGWHKAGEVFETEQVDESTMTICAEQPASAAPPAIPAIPMEAHSAAEDMGRVRTIPTTTDTTAPIRKG